MCDVRRASSGLQCRNGIVPVRPARKNAGGASKETDVTNRWVSIREAGWWICEAGVWVAMLVGVSMVQDAAAQSGASPGQPVRAVAVSTVPTGREQNLTAYVELLRADLRTQKIALISQMMNFTEAEDQAFWPIYRQYETELARLNDERLQGIETYSKTYTNLSDATANALMTKALDLEGRRVSLKQNFFSQLKGAMSAKTAARALQIENQILLLLDLQAASALPVAE
jgi:hypothetical protein